MHVHVYVMTIYIYIHFCEFSVISMHIQWKINDDKILTWNHPFPKDTLIGTNERTAGPPAGLRLLVLPMWTVDSPSAAGGGWCAVMALVRPNQCICHKKKKYDLLWTMSENKESILLSFLRENPLLWKPTKWNARNLSYWTGGRDTVQNQFIVEKPTMNIVLWMHGITAWRWWELILYMV